jgi:hypothetical protein
MTTPLAVVSTYSTASITTVRRNYMHYASKCTRSTHGDARAYIQKHEQHTVICVVVVCESIELFTDVMIYDGQVWSLLVQRYLTLG